MREPIRNTLAAVILAGLLASAPAAPQETTAEKLSKPVNLYRVDFAIHESEDGKRVNTRSYTQLVEVGSHCRVRAGNRVPIQTVIKGEPTVQYMDVGVRLDCRLMEERDGYLRLELLFEINSFAQEQEPKANPLLRNISSELQTVLVAGKPTVVSSVDDSVSKRRYELEVTATKIK